MAGVRSRYEASDDRKASEMGGQTLVKRANGRRSSPANTPRFLLILPLPVIVNSILRIAKVFLRLPGTIFQTVVQPLDFVILLPVSSVPVSSYLFHLVFFFSVDDDRRRGRLSTRSELYRALIVPLEVLNVYYRVYFYCSGQIKLIRRGAYLSGDAIRSDVLGAKLLAALSAKEWRVYMFGC